MSILNNKIRIYFAVNVKKILFLFRIELNWYNELYEVFLAKKNRKRNDFLQIYMKIIKLYLCRVINFLCVDMYV